MLKSFKNWLREESHNLTLRVNEQPQAFQKKKCTGLCLKCVELPSIPSNIAEGTSSRKEYLQFLSIAYSSSGELETHMLLAHDLGFLNESCFKQVVALEEVTKLLFTLIRSLRKDITTHRL
jgi:four helix bundle protein